MEQTKGERLLVIRAMPDSGMSLGKALLHAGASRNLYYYAKTRRTVSLDPVVTEKAREIAVKRPTYGTRRIAAQLTRVLGTPVNRKKVQRVYRALDWIEPSKRKREIIRSSDKAGSHTQLRSNSSMLVITRLFGF
ncbi:MAG: transposase [Nitrososphaerota archaeon]|nr:transposase [Nitrososphaerota archaeon]MDG6977604.1 transposase [Nitrososphaerota archaeon]